MMRPVRSRRCGAARGWSMRRRCSGPSRSSASPSFRPSGGRCCMHSPPTCRCAGSQAPGRCPNGLTVLRSRSCGTRRERRISPPSARPRPITRRSRPCAGRVSSSPPAGRSPPTSLSRQPRPPTMTTTFWPCVPTPALTCTSCMASRSRRAARGRRRRRLRISCCAASPRRGCGG